MQPTSSRSKAVLFVIILMPITLGLVGYYYYGYLFPEQSTSKTVSIRDPNLKVEVVTEGLAFPTTMAFLGLGDILVLEKNNGTVKRIINDTMLLDPVLDVSVANKYERGLLGIGVSKYGNGTKHVFLSYTETNKEGGDECPRPNYCLPGHDPLGNRIYRYEWDNTNNKLINPVLLSDLPAIPIPTLNGGKIVIGPDKNVYFTIGDLYHRSSTQNYPNRTSSNGTSAIYRITQDGNPVQAILGNEHPLDKYYAYGIRNSFGIDFDPVTGKLWDTENGPAFGDEINLVEPGFNSGWRKVQGIWDVIEVSVPGGRANYSDLNNKIRQNPQGLEDFGGNGSYSAPEFTWFKTTAPTAIKFLNSEKLGKQYQNDIFVGDYENGNIYHFRLNQNRIELILEAPLYDKIADVPEELERVIFGQGFGAITDIQVGPDGYLYVVSTGSNGKIYRIVPGG